MARYIKMKGRVNKADLLIECNKLIRMTPKNEDKAKIKLEEKALLEGVEKEYVTLENQAWLLTLIRFPKVSIKVVPVTLFVDATF